MIITKPEMFLIIIVVILCNRYMFIINITHNDDILVLDAALSKKNLIAVVVKVPVLVVFVVTVSLVDREVVQAGEVPMAAMAGDI